MFKIAKLEKVNNEKVSINLITYEQSKYENGKKILTEIVKTLSFDISGDNYSFGFDLNCKLEELLELPMNETIDFKDYILDGETFDFIYHKLGTCQTRFHILAFLNQ